jgi:hypothetical protein
LADDTLRRAAFGDRPDLMITKPPADPASRWLAAVALGGQGHYAAATTLLYGLNSAADPVVSALAASTLAAHRRQLGGHAAARVLDAAALSRLASAGAPAPGGDPDGMDAAGALSDALLGLAADALGAGRIGEARRLVAAAAERDATGWRGAVRLGWVSAEVELGAGRAEEAVPHAEAAAERAAAAGSARHRVKSALVLGAALAAGGKVAGRQRAVELLSIAQQEADELGLRPLVWPCALVLAELEPAYAPEHRRRAGRALHCVLRRADPIGRRLAESSPWVPDLTGLTG